MVRQFEQQDYSQVLQLHINFQNHLSELRPDLYNPITDFEREKASFTEYLNMKGTVCYVALQGETVIGYISAYRCKPHAEQIGVDRRYALIDEIFVLPAYRRKDIGKALIGKIKGYYEEQGIHRVELYVLENNTNAHNLYEKCGFRPQIIRMELDI